MPDTYVHLQILHIFTFISHSIYFPYHLLNAIFVSCNNDSLFLPHFIPSPHISNRCSIVSKSYDFQNLFPFSWLQHINLTQTLNSLPLRHFFSYFGKHGVFKTSYLYFLYLDFLISSVCSYPCTSISLFHGI